MKLLTFAALLALPIVVQATVFAQNTSPKRFAIKAGALFPSDKTKLDVINDRISFGISYEAFRNRSATKTQKSQLVGELYLDFLTSGTEVNYLIGGLSGRFDFSTGKKVTPYLGLGIGAAYVHTHYYPVGDHSGTVVAGHIQGGLTFRGGFLLETEYVYVGKVRGFDPSGVNLRLGYRF